MSAIVQLAEQIADVLEKSEMPLLALRDALYLAPVLLEERRAAMADAAGEGSAAVVEADDSRGA
jgi:hypothetical protein